MQLNVMISRLLGSQGCGKLLAGDGITTSEMTVKGMQGILEAVSIDVRLARKSVPEVGQAASVAKNLDEYQFLICSLVPSLPDSDPSKMRLQKYRIGIVAAFAMLAVLLKDLRPQDLAQWSRHAGSLLEEASETYVKAKSGSGLQITGHREAFEFFGVPVEKIEAALAAFYGQ